MLIVYIAVPAVIVGIGAIATFYMLKRHAYNKNLLKIQDESGLNDQMPMKPFNHRRQVFAKIQDFNGPMF